MTNHRARALGVLLALLLMMAGACAPPERTEPLAIAPDVFDRLAQFAPTAVKADLSTLSDSERQVVDKLIEAGRHMDRAFLLQAWPENPAFRERLAAQQDSLVMPALTYFDIMYGPWGRPGSVPRWSQVAAAHRASTAAVATALFMSLLSLAF